MENKEIKAKGKYTITEKVIQAHKNDIKYVTGVNEPYWNDFANNSGKAESSLVQYKSAVYRFTQFLNKDVLETTIEDLNNYLETVAEGKTRENQQRYINSFLIYTINNNLEKAIKATSSDLILSLIPTEYKNLIKVLMSK